MKKLWMILPALFLTFGIAACEEKSDMDKAQDHMEDAAEDMEDATKDMQDSFGN